MKESDYVLDNDTRADVGRRDTQHVKARTHTHPMMMDTGSTQ